MTYGSQWSAILGADTEQITDIVTETIEKGSSPVAGSSHQLADEDGHVGMCRVDLLDHGNGTVAQSRIVCSFPEGGDHGDVQFGFPLLVGGMPNWLRLREVKEVGSPLEAVLECTTLGGACVALYDPYYPALKNTYMTDSTVEFVVAGLAYMLRKAEQNSVTITDGPMVEMRRRDMLKENPDADVSGINSVELRLAGMTMLMPRDDGDAEMRGTVLDLSWHEFRGVRVAKITVLFRGGEDTGDTVFPIYAAAHVLDGYDPIPGDDIEGVIWLQGYPSWYASSGPYRHDPTIAPLQPIAGEFAGAMNTADKQRLLDVLAEAVVYRSERAGNERQGKAAVADYLAACWADLKAANRISHFEIGAQVSTVGEHICALSHSGDPDNLVAVFRLQFTDQRITAIDVSYRPEDRRVVRRSGAYPH